MKKKLRKRREGRRKRTKCSALGIGIRDWDGAPRRGPAAGEASRRDRCRIKIAGKKKKTNWGAWFYFTLDLPIFPLKPKTRKMKCREIVKSKHDRLP